MGRGEGRQARESHEANSQGAWSWFSPAGKDLETVWVILQNCPALIEDERIGVVVALQPSHWFRLSSQSKSPGISWLQTNRLLLPEGIPPFSSVQFSHSVLSDSLRPHDMNHSIPGVPVHHQLPDFTQTHVHRVGYAIQPSYPLSSPSPPAPNPSQHQGLPVSQLFISGGQSIRVSASASVLPMNTQDWYP